MKTQNLMNYQVRPFVCRRYVFYIKAFKMLNMYKVMLNVYKVHGDLGVFSLFVIID